MKGFDEKFQDVPDYILRITREIWEERGIGPALRKYYADNVLVRAANGMISNNRGVAAATLQTLHEFPDRQLVAEDIIWNGTEDSGFLSSHRLISVMHHTGSGVYGEATGKLVRSRIIAECWIHNNQVHEEWLVRDQAAFANCLGMSPRALAEHQVQQDLESTGSIRFFTPEFDVAGKFRPQIEAEGDASIYAAYWREIWGDKHLAAIRSLYAADATVNIPGGSEVTSHSEIDRFVIGYLSAFPDGDLVVEQLMANPGEGDALRIAMRWSMEATHSGYGNFGAPSGAKVYIMGMTQALLVNGKVEEEWILIDEIALWKQIIAHRDYSRRSEDRRRSRQLT